MMSESRVMSDVVSFFLIVVDEDRKQFAVEGPLTDHKPWSRAIAAAQGEGRKIRCCNISEKTRTDTIAVWLRQGVRVPLGSDRMCMGSAFAGCVRLFGMIDVRNAIVRLAG
jgi:hypothetical protein